jgi:hypothetical protein
MILFRAYLQKFMLMRKVSKFLRGQEGGGNIRENIALHLYAEWMPFDEKNVDQTYMHVSPLNYCPAAFAALLLYKERLQYVNERNLRLY